MSSDLSPNYRGVHCRRCGKPVRVPALVMKKDSEVHGHHDSNEMEYHLISQVFVLRCRSCQKESIYSINQIVDFAMPPVAAQSDSHAATA